ncbi:MULTISPECIES: hypothetical protein [Xanthobacter]|uniref:hypothetical protein n=1 Tax=Xanthobacter autotrophicus TaxID=280 RepID=UPI003729A685
MSAFASSELAAAVDALWRVGGPMKGNFYAAPTFVNLRETCQRLFPAAGSKDAVNSALSRAVYRLGFRWAEAGPARLAVPSDVAAARITNAFTQTESRRVHLCPLDLGDDVPNVRFGPNVIRTFAPQELDDLVDPDQLARRRPDWCFDSQRFAQFSWLVVEETVAHHGEPGARLLPGFFFDAREDFGRIKPHKPRFPTVVEDALFALLTAPWEDVTEMRDYEWRPFRVPWVYTLIGDLFAHQALPPAADTLSWIEDYQQGDDGETEEYERPLQWQLTNAAVSETNYLNDEAWGDLVAARASPLFAGPISHFVVRAFASDGIDEFLAQITVIEAALGVPDDYNAGRRPKLSRTKNPGATARVATRLSALLGDSAAGERYRGLFKERSDFLHGQAMRDISSQSRLDARRLARRCVCALIGAAISEPRPENQDAFLSELLQRGWSGVESAT